MNARKELRRLAHALEQEANALHRVAHNNWIRAQGLRLIAGRFHSYAEAEKHLAAQPEVVNKLHPFEAK